jgi:hypothetical protein
MQRLQGVFQFDAELVTIMTVDAPAAWLLPHPALGGLSRSC